MYGDHLYERRDFEQSALGKLVSLSSDASELTRFGYLNTAFSLGTRWRKALLAYEKAHMWKEAFALTSRAELTEEDVSNLASRIAGENKVYCYVEVSLMSALQMISTVESDISKQLVCSSIMAKISPAVWLRSCKGMMYRRPYEW